MKVAKVRIVTWNMGKRHPCGLEALEDGSVDVILGQEVPIKRSVKDTLGGGSTSKYWKVWGGGRAGVWVNKRWDRSTWRTVVTEKDVVGVELQGLQVFSVYSPGHCTNWETPLSKLVEMESPNRAIVAGDFNLHHPMWSKDDRHSPGAELLLELATKWDLELITTPGEPTWFRQGYRDSTLDLFWGTTNVRSRFEGAWEWSGSDHVPQLATVWLEEASPMPSTPKPNWKLMNPERVKERAEGLDIGWASTPAELDQMADRLVQELGEIQDETVPKTRGSGGTKRSAFWNHRTVESTQKLRRAERLHRNRKTEFSAQQLRAARAAQKKTLSEESTRAWRETTRQASTDRKLLWKLASWGKSRSHMPTENAQIPDLLGEGETVPAQTKEEKARVLAQRFFPDTEPGEEPMPCPTPGWIQAEADMIRVSFEDVGEALIRPQQWKAAGPDGIPNGFLRACGDPLIEAIRRIAATSLAIGYYPRAFKKARVIVLRKPGKTVSQLRTAGGWRPISLLSCIGKVVESVMTAKMSRLAEKAGILPPEQMGNREKRSTELAARFVVETVRSAWSMNLTSSLLQLDLKGAFDRVHHGWLVSRYPPCKTKDGRAGSYDRCSRF